MALPAGNAGLAPPAKRSRTESLPPAIPDAPAGPSGFGRGLAPVPASLVLLAHDDPAERTSGGLAPAVPASSDYASRLPTELLELIFGFLPLSCQGAAAQACRRWYSHMPDTRLELARWLAQRTSCLSELAWHIMAGYSGRTGPWLTGQGCALLPLLQCQYQYCLQQGLLPELAGGRVAARPVRWLAGLVLYSLYQCRVRAPELPFRPVALANRPGRISISGITLSLDGLRMALICHAEPQGTAVLRVYGWKSGSWQQETLMTASQPVVSQVCFAVGQLDTLFSCHSNGQLLLWRRQADTATWYPQEVYKTAELHRVNRIRALTGGDLFIETSTEHSGEKWLVFCRYDADSQTRDCTTSRRYPDGPYAMAEGLDRLAVAVINRQHKSARMEIHVWKRGLDPVAPRDWGCQDSPLETQGPPSSLTWSGDRQQLLARVPFQGGSRLWILTVDQHCRLRSQVFFPPHLAPELVSLAACRLLDLHSSRCLVVPESMRQMQFWHREEVGSWQPGARLQTVPDTGVAADQLLRYVLLPDDGRTLVRATEKEVAIWQDIGTAVWQRAVWRRVLLHRVDSPEAPVPDCGRLAGTGLIWITGAGRGSTLWLYGPDAEGRIVRKTAFDTGETVRFSVASFDGLSLMLRGHHGHTLFLHAHQAQ